MEIQNVFVSFQGKNAADVLGQMSAFAGSAAADPMAKVGDEDLLVELRDRMAKKGQVVKVMPFANEPSAEKDAEETSSKPARTPRATKPAKEEPKPVKAEAQQPASEKEPANENNDDWSDDKDISDDAGAKVTIDDVKAALNAYAGVHGQAKARDIMLKKGGDAALKNIPEVKYSALVAALKLPEAA